MTGFLKKVTGLSVGKLLAMVGVVGVVLLFLVITLAKEAVAFVSSIDDPIERGLAYIAFAIVFHAILGRGNK